MNVLRPSYVFMLTLLLVLGGQVYAASAAGYRTLTPDDLTIGVWYPSDTPEQDGQIGPFDVRLAFDAPPKAGGRHQFVLMSHGRLGRMRNHHLTATALANAGFIVVAPLHTPDPLMSEDDTPKVLDWRVRELRHALEAVLRIDSFRRMADLSRIHAVGYSLGTVTALNAAGAAFDGALANEHCTRNDDPRFCVPLEPSVIERIQSARGTVTPVLDRDIPPRHFPLPFVNGGVALIAPIGQGIVYDENTFRARELFIVGLDEDMILPPRFHAENLDDVFPERYIRHFSIRPGHHFSFIAPFAKRVTDREDIPVAGDPPGYDRKAFLDTLNQDLVSFFVEQAQTP